MPPGPAFGWLCVLCSVTDIAVRAAQIRATQVLPTRPTVVASEFSLRKSRADGRQLKAQLASDAQATHEPKTSRTNDAFSADPSVNIYLSHLDKQPVAPAVLPSRSGKKNATVQCSMTANSSISTEPGLETPPHDVATSHALLPEDASPREITLDSTSIPIGIESQGHEIESSLPLDYDVCFYPILPASSLLTFVSPAIVCLFELCCNQLASTASPAGTHRLPSNPLTQPPVIQGPFVQTWPAIPLRRCVFLPSSSLIIHRRNIISFALCSLVVTGLAASLSYGAASEVLRRSTTSHADNTQSVMMTEANITRLVSKLSQMRGAALKLGQFMSIQGAHSFLIVPPHNFARIF